MRPDEAFGIPFESLAEDNLALADDSSAGRKEHFGLQAKTSRSTGATTTGDQTTLARPIRPIRTLA